MFEESQYGILRDHTFHSEKGDVCGTSHLSECKGHYPPVSSLGLSCSIVAPSYNRPRFLHGGCWDSNAITITDSSLLLNNVTRILVTKTNRWYATVNGLSRIFTGIGGSVNSTITTNSGYSVFVAGNDNVYSYDDANMQVNVWLGNTTSHQPVMFIRDNCAALFVNLNNTLYCSVPEMHQVVAKSLDDPTNTLTIVAGTGCYGSASNLLAYQRGIFVDLNSSLYVADTGNNRIQRFSSGGMNASTVVGTGAPGTMILSSPMDIVLDGDGYLFIVDTGNNRIIGSGPNGFRCVVGCANASGSIPNGLMNPNSMSFDSDGNIWVADTGNGRIQKFMFRDASSCKYIISRGIFLKR